MCARGLACMFGRCQAKIPTGEEGNQIGLFIRHLELITIHFTYVTFVFVFVFVFFVLFLIEQDHVVMAIQTVKRDCAALAVTVKPSVNAN